MHGHGLHDLFNSVPDYLMPSGKGVMVVGLPIFLSITQSPILHFADLNWWEMAQWGLSILVAGAGSIDFALKIRWKLRRDREEKRDQKNGKNGSDGK